MADDIPPKFYDALKKRIEGKVDNRDAYGKGCWEWTGCRYTDGRYGRIHLYICGDNMYVTAHRASYIAFHRKFDLEHDISHRCHEKLCVNPGHLSHEPRYINLRRDSCRKSKDKKCTGHGRYKHCIL